jgi:hypothetical protein
VARDGGGEGATSDPSGQSRVQSGGVGVNRSGRIGAGCLGQGPGVNCLPAVPIVRVSHQALSSRPTLAAYGQVSGSALIDAPKSTEGSRAAVGLRPIESAPQRGRLARLEPRISGRGFQENSPNACIVITQGHIGPEFCSMSFAPTSP